MMQSNRNVKVEENNVATTQTEKDINVNKKEVKITNLKNNLLILGFCFVVSFLFLMVCSQNSFLYSFNCFPDCNFYVTMGRSINAGKVPYKDVFDHKGPLLYILFACFTWFKDPFIGVFILEIIATTAFLFFAYKICNRYLGKYASFIATLLIATITITSSFNYAGGGAVEEFCLPFITYLFLCFIEFIQDKKQFSKLRCVTIGVVIGVMFWIKFTMLVSAIFIMLYWLVVSLKNKKFKQTFISIGFMLIGFMAVSFISLIYYAFKGALVEVFYVYFYLNLFKYNSSQFGAWLNYLKILLYDYPSFCLMLISLPLTFIHNKKSFGWAYLGCFIFNLLFMTIQYCYIYYFVQLFPFVVFGIAMIFKSFKNVKVVKVAKIVCTSILAIVCFSSSFLLCGATSELGNKKESYAQFQVADAVHKIADEKGIDNPTMFCYMMNDFGFYNAAKLIPSVKFYAKCNFTKETLPEMYNDFDTTINQQKVDFIICFEHYYRESEELQNYYALYDTYRLNQYSNSLNNKCHDVVLLVNKQL